MPCIQCQKPNKDEIIAETRYWIVQLAIDQTYLGRCWVTLKRHVGDLADLKPTEWRDFIKLIKKLEAALKKSFNATMFNWTCLMNGAYKNNSLNPHVHWHLRPRYRQSVKLVGLVFKDTDFGSHYKRGTNRIISKKARKEIIERIKENLGWIGKI